MLGGFWVHISPSLHPLRSGIPDFSRGGRVLSLCLARHLKQQVARLALKRTHLEPEALKCGGCGAGKGSRAGEGWAEAGDRLCGPEVAPDPDPRPSGGAEGHVSCPP